MSEPGRTSREKPNEEEAQWSEWMAEAQQGDSTAYEKLLRAILPSTRAFVMSRMRNHDAAEDVVQNVLLSVHRSRHTYRASRPFGPWLRAVTRNAVTDAFRSQQRRQGREDPLENHEAATELQHIDTHDFGEDPALANALSHLPPLQREAVELLHVRDMSVAEAAALAGVSQNAFKVRAHRGRAALKRLLGGKRP
jgi:RNA polymerase sigma factor (sigma-70 family)